MSERQREKAKRKDISRERQREKAKRKRKF